MAPSVSETPATLARRVAAISLDWAASWLVATLVLLGGDPLAPDSSLAIMLVFFLEVTALTWLAGSSFGQRLVGLRVLALDGGRLSLWRIALRTALICVVVPAVIYDSEGRGLHDRAVGSRVVRVERISD